MSFAWLYFLIWFSTSRFLPLFSCVVDRLVNAWSKSWDLAGSSICGSSVIINYLITKLLFFMWSNVALYIDIWWTHRPKVFRLLLKAHSPFSMSPLLPHKKSSSNSKAIFFFTSLALFCWWLLSSPFWRESRSRARNRLDLLGKEDQERLNFLLVSVEENLLKLYHP